MISKEELERLYWKEELTMKQIGEKLNKSADIIKYWMKKHNISRRTKSEVTIRKISGENSPMFGKRGKGTPMFGKHPSKETRKKMRKAKKGIIPWNKGKTGICSEETIKKISGENNSMFGKHHSEATKRKMSGALKGENSPMFGKTYEEIFGKEKAKEMKRKLSEARKHQVFPRYKTKPELKFMELIKKYNLPYKFTGDSRFWIENINPDFINCNGEKICVEVFGDYWHNLQKAIIKDKEKLITLKKYGWKRIIIWEHELMNIPKCGKQLSQQEIINKIPI